MKKHHYEKNAKRSIIVLHVEQKSRTRYLLTLGFNGGSTQCNIRRGMHRKCNTKLTSYQTRTFCCNSTYGIQRYKLSKLTATVEKEYEMNFPCDIVSTIVISFR